jgi:hypothetical protein
MFMLYDLFPTCTVLMQLAHRFTTLLSGINYLIRVTHFRRARIVAKSAYSLCHIHLSICMYQRGSYWTDFHEIWYWRLESP